MPTVWSDLKHVSRCTPAEHFVLYGRIRARRKHATTNTDDTSPASHAAHTKRHNLQMRTVAMERRIRIEGLCSRGRSRLKWLKIGTGQKQWYGRASVPHVHRDRKALKPLADNSPLCQVVADRAIRLVVTALSVSGR
jgi:hypothetical protein